jgi:glycerol-3-phosphate acyltransferase PlsY
LSVWAGVCAILGHNYTCWLKFKGGKGIATTAGVMLALLPLALVVALAGWIVVLAVSRYVSLASITAAAILPFAVWGTGGSRLLIGVAAGLGMLAIFKHKGNIQRLRNGTESRIAPRRGEAAAPTANETKS